MLRSICLSFFMVLSIVPLAGPSLAAEPQAAARNPSEVVETLNTEIPVLMKRFAVPGLSIALIENRVVVWTGAFGVKNVTRPDKVDTATVFEAASMSKPVFAFAVLKLADQGKFDLDKPLSEYLPGYIGKDDRINRITARIVMTHRTGFPNWRRAGPLKIQLEPGERFSYSGEGFVYLQHAVERVTGKSLNEFVSQYVFEPLGMNDSSYAWRSDYETRAAWGHDQEGTPGDRFDFGIAGHRFPWKDSAPNAAATLITSASDYAKFVIAVMHGTGLRQQTSREMLTSQTKVDAGCYMCIDQPFTHPDSAVTWGLGLGLEKTARNRYFWQWGDNNGFKAFMIGSPSSGAGLVVLTNSDRGMSLIPEIVSLATGEPHPLFDWLQYKN